VVSGKWYAVSGNKDACGRQCRQAVQTRLCGGISADLTFLLLFWSSKKVEENRGFTGHEHYPELNNIINMNGRLYDPKIGRFFSPDNFVQMPEFSQSFNRYSYCLNNPLKYRDPTGQLYVDDIWDFDQNGNFIQRIENTDYDQIRVWNTDRTQILSESKHYPFGTFENTMGFHKQPDVELKGELHDITGLSMDFSGNYEGAMIAFKFLAANTNPEWHALGRSDFKGGMDNLLFTTHRPDFEYFGARYATASASNGGLFYDFHSHKTTLFPSNITSNGHDSDIEYRLGLTGKGKSPNAIFGILYQGVISDYRGQKIDYLKLFK
jgi:RHS repeat-associated protein